MTSVDKLDVLSVLQQMALDTEDPSQLLTTLLPQTIEQLSRIGLKYQFISFVFITDDKKPKYADVIDVNFHKEQNQVKNVLDIEGIFEKVETAQEQKKEEMVTLSDVSSLIMDGYYAKSLVKCLVVSPIYISKKLVGLLIFASYKPAEQMETEEVEVISLLSRIYGLNFRLQDSQTSLTAITQEVYKMNAQLHQLDKLKDDFVSVASHELRTPMAAIRSYTWMAINRSDIPLSEKLKKYLSRTLISTERLINLVNDMLNISRIESGRIQIEPKVFNIYDLISEVYSEVDAKAKEKEVVVEVSKNPVPQVFADPDKLHQVLLNLVGNSLKFTPPGGKIIISLFSDGHTVETSVKDSGVGIAQEDLSRLFQKFGRLDNSYVAMGTSGGTGLGLFICKSLVELMKGKISASSEGVNKGATFAFSLPVATEDVLKEAEKYRYNPTGEAKGLEPVAI